MAAKKKKASKKAKKSSDFVVYAAAGESGNVIFSKKDDAKVPAETKYMTPKPSYDKKGNLTGYEMELSHTSGEDYGYDGPISASYVGEACDGGVQGAIGQYLEEGQRYKITVTKLGPIPTDGEPSVKDADNDL